MITTAYRPRNAGHDYYGRGTYLITLVVSGRQSLLSRLPDTGTGAPSVLLTPLGAAVEQAWQRTPEAQAAHGNRVVVHASVCMPDHFHGVIEVLDPMEWSLGDRSYGAFGNLFLLRWARKIQVMCHRRHPVTGQRYEDTADYADDRRQCFHNLNALAAEICTFNGEAKILRNK
ncbi:MAG: hypothetical protein J5545_08790 [Bacteroidaceae bacterium]|nr:hypothetical protein [Bacteroidaceae bacterium]